MENIDNLETAIACVEELSSSESLCKFDDETMSEYNELYDRFIKTNANKNCSSEEKGKSLEKLASFLLSHTKVFEVYDNIHSNTNEFDQLVRCNNIGKILLNKNVLDKRLKHFIGECKNLSRSVNVTYVGKVCSLLMTTGNKICILFSYNGVSGKEWKQASGLIRKFYLSKENIEERFVIIDFNKFDFERIKNGEYLLDIINDKIFTLQNDVNFSNFISSHSLAQVVLCKQNND